MKRLSILFLTLLSFTLLISCSEKPDSTSNQKLELVKSSSIIFKEIDWEELEPASQSNLPQYLPEELVGFDIESDSIDNDLDAENSLAGLSLPQPYLTSATAIAEMNGQAIKIPGFIVPLEFEGTTVTEFFLVPYFGACYHKPPPPPNQIIYVTASKGIEIEDTYEPVWIKGVIETKQKGNEVATALYSLELHSLEKYIYE